MPRAICRRPLIPGGKWVAGKDRQWVAQARLQLQCTRRAAPAGPIKSFSLDAAGWLQGDVELSQQEPSQLPVNQAESLHAAWRKKNALDANETGKIPKMGYRQLPNNGGYADRCGIIYVRLCRHFVKIHASVLDSWRSP
jgi:hypothetical protein